MRVSFSLVHPERADANERAVRREAEVSLTGSGARLIEALGLVGCEDGLALGFAFRDIALDPEMPQASLAVAEVLDALAMADTGLRCRIAGLRAALAGLLVRIDEGQDEFSMEAADPASARFSKVG